MSWLLLKIEAPAEQAEALSDALMELDALSSSIEDANAETPDEQPIFGEPGDPPPGIWQHSIVTALLTEDTDIRLLVSKLEQQCGLSDLRYSTEMLAEQDWVRATQSQFEPIRIRDDLWIVPTWHDAPNPHALNIVLDPGLAFGTGSHPTTHLCLAWLADQLQAGSSVLDYGCGSGILAIAARKLGAGQVHGVDIDPQAILSSQQNAVQNGVVADFYLPDDQTPPQVDVVLANILSSALTLLAPALAGYCKPGGKIALSGILREQEAAITAIYEPWFDMQAAHYMDAWVLLHGIRK
ncbi:50S ribosomal protein L11 methyltransferase [Pseudomethylobacillus aquaticus]|uniref:Ribosomal protein L11 methyltransferase n=1 Tax=Pseudomethylobacillus aquaticus TaxID=2676064 RepID=A0A3N0V245_9PROT|nr:50S ribosomal protein L11 methyltransferase [Pseudomethylobacillus aquaticus]ROH86859.1 50S ribosomal protein L11 methyltransferase [Pseudomethylobacillus aquaticus]